MMQDWQKQILYKESFMKLKRVIQYAGAEIIETQPGLFTALPNTPSFHGSRQFKNLAKAKFYLKQWNRN
tara:strand:- start:1709 stop:1915 length:207 start_codon:yes stop_codon:yes gene_type:complete